MVLTIDLNQFLELLYKMHAVRNTAASVLTMSILVKNASSCSNRVETRWVDSKKLCFGESSIHIMNCQGKGETHLQM